MTRLSALLILVALCCLSESTSQRVYANIWKQINFVYVCTLYFDTIDLVLNEFNKLNELAMMFLLIFFSICGEGIGWGLRAIFNIHIFTTLSTPHPTPLFLFSSYVVIRNYSQSPLSYRHSKVAFLSAVFKLISKLNLAVCLDLDKSWKTHAKPCVGM